MTTITGADTGVDMRVIEIAGNAVIETDITTLSDTEFTVDSVDGSDFVYTGTGFVDNDHDGIPDTGIMTGTVISFDGTPFLEMTDFSMPWESYWTFVSLGDDDGWLNAMFGGDDTFTGSTANDYLTALGGDDVMNGLGGKDFLDGGKGRDTIDGGSGKDRINGGASQDTLTGGGGTDTFIFSKPKDSGVGANKHDIITDYNGDIIDIHKMNDGSFHFGGDAFDGEAGEIIGFGDFGGMVVQVDTNGDAIPDIEILLREYNPVPVDTLSINF
jgi:Ca2+-binding RTX toxin-like protein